jgi:hypothetical protein
MSTDTLRTDVEETLDEYPRVIAEAAKESVDRPVTIYYLCWRLKANHPWFSEEFFNRFDAHSEYFDRMQRGMEVYLEVRRRERT